LSGLAQRVASASASGTIRRERDHAGHGKRLDQQPVQQNRSREPAVRRHYLAHMEGDA
jgi:hypothetical protein